MRANVELENNGSKLCRQLLSLVDFSRGNNYESTHISVNIFDDHIVVGTFCVNEFGRAWDNENHTRVEKGDIPLFAAKKLGIV
jgi:hypothetical protein